LIRYVTHAGFRCNRRNVFPSLSLHVAKRPWIAAEGISAVRRAGTSRYLLLRHRAPERARAQRRDLKSPCTRSDGLVRQPARDVYSRGESEEIVGKALKDRRDRVVLATKAHGSLGEDPNERGNSRRWLIRECDASLRRLGTDWIDLCTRSIAGITTPTRRPIFMP
jgi:hypothetical protein